MDNRKKEVSGTDPETFPPSGEQADVTRATQNVANLNISIQSPKATQDPTQMLPPEITVTTSFGSSDPLNPQIKNSPFQTGMRRGGIDPSDETLQKKFQDLQEKYNKESANPQQPSEQKKDDSVESTGTGNTVELQSPKKVASASPRLSERSKSFSVSPIRRERKNSTELEPVEFPSQKLEQAEKRNLMPGSVPSVRRNSKDDSALPSAPSVDVIGAFTDYLGKQGYKQLVHVPVSFDDPLIKGAQPITNGRPNLGDNDANGMAGRFVASGNTIYSLRVRGMLGAQKAESKESPSEDKIKAVLYGPDGERRAMNFRELRDGSFIFLVMLIQTPEGQLNFELRVIPYGQGNHEGLTLAEEAKAMKIWDEDPSNPDGKICVVAGGEGFNLKSQGGLVMVNTKTGRNHGKLAKLGVDQEAVVRKFFDPYASPLYKNDYFFDCSKCAYGTVNVQILETIIKRGIAKDMIPDDYIVPNPSMPNEVKAWELLSDDFKKMAEDNSIFEANFRDQQKQARELAKAKQVPITTTSTTTTNTTSTGMTPSVPPDVISPAPLSTVSDVTVLPFGQVTGYQENSMFKHSSDLSDSTDLKPEQDNQNTNTDEKKQSSPILNISPTDYI